MDKLNLRKVSLAHRRALTPDEVMIRSEAILQRLWAVSEFAASHTILCYVSSKDNEVDTIPLIRNAISSGMVVLVPIARKNGVMEWSHLHALEELAPSRFGILEPLPEMCRIVTPPPDAVVIVPGIAFTRDGHRIGYGGGYYDRFLATHQGASIALAFDVQIIDTLAIEPHDTPVDFLITESQVWQCRSLRT